jgi:hypothetical protein
MGTEVWRDLMRDVVILEPFAGLDGYGEATYGAARTIRARVVGRQRLIRTVTGEERLSAVTVYLAEAVGAGPQDRVTLPAAFQPTQPPLLAVARWPDETGSPMEVLYA